MKDGVDKRPTIGPLGMQSVDSDPGWAGVIDHGDLIVDELQT